MSFVVTLVPADHVFGRTQIKTFGPYGTAELAEAARRRVHFDANEATATWQQFPVRAPRTYVTELETER